MISNLSGGSALGLSYISDMDSAQISQMNTGGWVGAFVGVLTIPNLFAWDIESPTVHGLTNMTFGTLGLLGGIGISKMKATGKVYDLKSIDDFPGVYGRARTGAVAGDKSTGTLWLENPAGVYLRLDTEREGLALSLGADGMLIEMKD